MYCICCKKDNITPLQHDEEMSEEDYIFSVEGNTSTDNRMWGGGIVQIISAGYGSNHDTDKYVIAICDDCITKESEEGTLLNYGNYMSPNSSYTRESIEKSKQIYRRRKNLDELV